VLDPTAEQIHVPDSPTDQGPGDAVATALMLAVQLGSRLPQPGGGSTLRLWDALSRIAAQSLTTARVIEPHLDARAILAQANLSCDQVGAGDEATWGVFAAEGAGVRLTATDDGGQWLLEGSKPWCSLAGRLSHALVTAWTSPTERRLFAVDLAHPGVAVTEAGWASLGLAEIPSLPVTFTQVPALAVGAGQWYLTRPGFWWGSMAVAACWYGGAAAVATRLLPRLGRIPDQVALMHLGAADTALSTARVALQRAAAEVDGTDPHPEITARRVRAAVRRTADEMVTRTARATGPAPLALDADHAHRVADLSIYIRQEHAERDLAALGSALLPADDDEL
jgi:alkylation response protein AidB-like acyl-CoA dehydrogenase